MGALLPVAASDSSTFTSPVLTFTSPIPTPTPANHEKIEALHRAGMDDKAWEKLQTAIETDPNNDTLFRLANQPWAWWQRVGIWWRVYLLPFIQTVVALGLTIAIIVFLVKYRTRQQKLSVDIEEFDLGAVKLEPSPSSGLASRIEQALNRLGATDKLHRPGLIDKPVESLELPADLASVPKEVHAVWNFVTNLFPANVVALSGVLQHDTMWGVGLTLRLVNRKTNALWATHTIWQHEVNPTEITTEPPASAAGYFQLVEAAAVWTYWQIYQHRHPGAEATLRRTFGTDHWQSYAIHRAGARLSERGGDSKTVEQLFRRALTFDRNNRFALFNLAVTEIEKIDITTVDKQAVDYIYRQPKKHLGQVSALTPSHTDPACIFARYQCGAISLYKYLLTNKQEHLRPAKGYLKRATQAAEMAAGKKGTAITTELVAMIKIAYAHALQLANEKTQAQTIVDTIEKENHFAPWVLYNLACYYSSEVQFKPTEAEKEKMLDTALNYLEGALLTNPAYAAWAKNDPSLKALHQLGRFKRLVTPEAEQDAPHTSLTSIKGIGPNRAKTLREKAGVSSVEMLLEVGATPKDRAALARKSSLPPELLYNWIKMADLMRLEGVGGAYAQLLLASGIDTVKELRKRTAEKLLEAMAETNATKQMVDRLPTEPQVAAWIEQAKQKEIVLVAVK